MLQYPGFNPIAFEIGPVKVHWYGIMYMVGSAGAWWLARVRAARRGSTWKPTNVNGEVRHPSQLYEACLEGLLLFTVVWWFTSRPRPRVAPSGLFLLIYGSARFVVEFVRVPDEHIGYLAGGWLTMGQVLSLPMIIAGAGLLSYAYRVRAPSGNVATAQ